MGSETALVAGAGLSAQAGATTFGAGSQLMAGMHNRRSARFNQRVSEFQADQAEQRGEEQERRHRTSVRGLIGAQRAALAAQGVDVDEGSAADVQRSSQRMAELDVATIRNNAALEAWGYQVQAADAHMQGRAAMTRGIGSAAGTLLGGGADVVSGYVHGRREGIFE